MSINVFTRTHNGAPDKRAIIENESDSDAVQKALSGSFGEVTIRDCGNLRLSGLDIRKLFVGGNEEAVLTVDSSKIVFASLCSQHLVLTNCQGNTLYISNGFQSLKMRGCAFANCSLSHTDTNLMSLCLLKMTGQIRGFGAATASLECTEAVAALNAATGLFRFKLAVCPYDKDTLLPESPPC